MAGMGATGAGFNMMGGTLGAIGDIIAASNYERPRLPDPSETERNLRRLAINQLQGGGQQTLGATALYNQMAPMLMGMLPGMHYVPGTDGGAGGGGGGGTGPLGSYQDALRTMQETQQRAQHLKDLNRQIKGMKAGAERRGLRQERQALRKQIKTSPRVADTQRMAYRAGTTPNLEMFDIRQTSPQTAQGSMAAYRGMMDAMQGNQPDFNALYQAG